MSLEEREFLESTNHFTRELNASRIGLFLAFVTRDDPHSPVMLPVYDEFLEYTEFQLPLLLVDSRDPQFDQLKLDLLIFSVPTLVWLQNDRMPHFRIVGTTTLKKLQDEFDNALEKELA